MIENQNRFYCHQNPRVLCSTHTHTHTKRARRQTDTHTYTHTRAQAHKHTRTLAHSLSLSNLASTALSLSLPLNPLPPPPPLSLSLSPHSSSSSLISGLCPESPYNCAVENQHYMEVSGKAAQQANTKKLLPIWSPRLNKSIGQMHDKIRRVATHGHTDRTMKFCTKVYGRSTRATGGLVGKASSSRTRGPGFPPRLSHNQRLKRLTFDCWLLA